jgi:hypothetical protein
LFKVIILGGLVMPTSVLEKVILPGRSVTRAALPVPARFDVCRLASSLTSNCPCSGPVILGVKVTSMVHWLLGAKVDPQVVADTAKSPIVEIVILFTDSRSLLIKVNVFAALVVLTNCGAKVNLAGIRPIPLPAIPMPVRTAVCGLLLALLLTINCPVRVPVAVGAKVTPIVHWLPLARLVPHFVAETAKSPVAEIRISVRVTDCGLLRVNVAGGLVVPTA